MSEKVIKTPEHVQTQSKEIKASAPSKAEYSQAEQQERLREAQEIVATESSTAEKPSLPPVIDERPQLIDHAVKAFRMRRNLASVQTKLTPGKRNFSKIVHQPLVQKVSEASSQSIARPSGILGGGIIDFVGCLGYQLLARHYGLPYNFTLFLLFFIVGFGLGLLGELVIRAAKRSALL